MKISIEFSPNLTREYEIFGEDKAEVLGGKLLVLTTQHPAFSETCIIKTETPK